MRDVECMQNGSLELTSVSFVNGGVHESGGPSVLGCSVADSEAWLLVGIAFCVMFEIISWSF
jgi:hypothetical protein